MPAKKSGKGRKQGRGSRKPGAALQAYRTYKNKLKQVNLELEKAGKPQIFALPGYDGKYMRISKGAVA